MWPSIIVGIVVFGIIGFSLYWQIRSNRHGGSSCGGSCGGCRLNCSSKKNTEEQDKA